MRTKEQIKQSIHDNKEDVFITMIELLEKIEENTRKVV